MAKYISVKGVVQGVGFCPFVYGLATGLNLHGWICNTPDGAEILVDGKNVSLEEFISSLVREKPALAQIDSMQIEDVLCDSASGNFEIRELRDLKGGDPWMLADIGICRDCERELFLPKDRRYLYPFVSCKNCGPRFTIIKDLPYDRANTTMRDFAMCDPCREEYTDSRNRRFHAHPIACPECGPFVELRETHSQFPTSAPRVSSIEIRVSAILKARRLLREGYIVAIKGPGGFHLACDASNPYTLAELRDRKGRSDKPFTVMAADLDTVASICQLQRDEQCLLEGPEKAIVLLSKKDTGTLSYKVSELVAPNLDTLGVMLPYTALHHLLLNQTDPVLAREPVPPILVMDSGNFEDEPIATDNKDALVRLSPLADAFLMDNREIHVRSDDSFVRVSHGSPLYLRRARGFAPYRLTLPCAVLPTLAVGAEARNTFCLARDTSAFLSHHIGDMEHVETQNVFEQGIQHLSHLFDVEPEVIAHDLHPLYFTTHYAQASALRRIAVQHHHAHIASCMADNGLNDRQVIGLAFDGNGYGSDGAVWGGEVLLASYTGFERFAHLEYLPLPGSDPALRSPWRLALGYAHALGIQVEDLPFLQNIDRKALRLLRQQADRRQNTPLTSSMGKLFDAAASLVGIRNEITYETQAALEMEVLSRPFLTNSGSYPYVIEELNGDRLIRLKQLFSSIVRDIRAGESVGSIGARFHKTVAEAAIEVCRMARRSTGISAVALSGGVWQNQILLELVREGLGSQGFTVYFHKQAPTNDGGLALGQVMVANHVVARGQTVPTANERRGNAQ